MTLTNTRIAIIAFILLLPFVGFSKDKEKKMSKKDMKSAMTGLNASVEDLKKKIADLEAEKNAAQSKADSLAKENATLKQDAETAKSKLEEANTNMAKVKATSTAPNGLAFKVQIGAYKVFNLSGYFDSPKALTTEDVDGYKKYVVGFFGDLEKAQGFEKDVKKMGVQDGWIVPYENGKRISDDEAEKLLGHPFRDKNAKAPVGKTAKAKKPAKKEAPVEPPHAPEQ